MGSCRWVPVDGFLKLSFFIRHRHSYIIFIDLIVIIRHHTLSFVIIRHHSVSLHRYIVTLLLLLSHQHGIVYLNAVLDLRPKRIFVVTGTLIHPNP